MGFLWGMPSSVSNHHNRPDDKHRKGQELSASKRSKIKTNLGVRLADKLNKKSKQAVKSHKTPEDRSRIEVSSVQPPENQEEHEALKECFIKLRRVPRNCSTFRKNHRPSHIGGPPE